MLTLLARRSAWLVALVVCLVPPVHAAQRTFVSTAGSDSNACSLAAPCRAFAKAITVTDPGGEIVALDSGGYGAVTVNQNVTILAPSGVYAGVSVSAGVDGITVTAPATEVVLRGLSINGQGGNNGVRVQAGEVHLESLVISNMVQAGILVEGGSSVRVSGTVVRSNAEGLHVVPASGTVTVLVRDSEFSNQSGAGIDVTPSGSGVARVTVERSSASKNAAGFAAAPGAGASAMLVVNQSVASDSTGAGVSSSGAGATVYVRESAIARNGTGFLQASNGVLNACGANLLVANNSAQSGSINNGSCLDVASGSGTVTNVATGAGLTGGPITASGTINLAGTQLLPTVACAANQVPQWNGSAWICGSVGAGSLGGSGTAGVLPLWTGAATLGNSVVHQASGNVGVSVAGPLVNQLQVGDTPGLSGNQLALGNGVQAMSFSLTPSATTWYSSTSFALQSTILGGDAHAGIGGIPTHNLDVFGGNAQVGLVNTANSTSATISKYTNRMEVSPIDAFQISVGGLANPHFWIGGNGNVGVGTTSPASKLQIGSVGASGYAANDIAFGNGTQASGIAQTASEVQWYSTTDIALMPHGNGHGRVGINTTTPLYPLDVRDFVVNAHQVMTWFNDNEAILGQNASLHTGVIDPQVSIRAESQVMATEFDANSDGRIKEIAGISDSARDLETIAALEVTDYTMKDKVRNGNKPFKKVIAQQVEKVYPQVVSQHVDFIPNVYRTASAVTKTAAGTLLHFEKPHGLTPSAKRLKLFTPADSVMQQVGIVSMPSTRDVVIDVPQLNGDKVFVYGEEVDDFRTVDYEGLTTLNISATQELAKRLAKQQADFAALVADKDAEVAELREQLAKQQGRVAELESLAADMSEIRRSSRR